MANGTERMTHAVVTGGAGFLGSHLCETLLKAGYRVTCVDNFETGKTANIAQLEARPRFQLLRCDINTKVDVSEHVDVVYHFASPAAPCDYLVDPVATLRLTSAGTQNVLDLARHHGARFVLSSTSEVYGMPTDTVSREDEIGVVNPVDAYGAYFEARRFSEALTTAYRTTYNVDTAIARIFNAYGPRMRLDDGRVLSRFIQQALAGTPLTIPGSGTQRRSLCYVDDVVAGVMALADGPYPGPVNIGSPEDISIYAIAQQIQQILGAGASVAFVDGPSEDSHARKPDIRRAQELLSWHPRTSVRDGLANTIAWFKATDGGYA